MQVTQRCWLLSDLDDATMEFNKTCEDIEINCEAKFLLTQTRKRCGEHWRSATVIKSYLF